MDREELFKRLVVVALVIGILIVGFTVVVFYVEAPLKRGEGTLSGRVTIGPVSPVCRVNATATGAPSGWASNQVVVLPQSGKPIYVPVGWTLSQGCELSGTFQLLIDAGTYRVDLSSCMSESNRAFGCASLPKTVSVSPNSTTFVDISVDTGIR